MASDLAFTTVDAMCKVLRKGLRLKGNEWNTDGCVNVALFIEDIFGKKRDIPSQFAASDAFVGLVQNTLKLMEEKRRVEGKEMWNSGSNKRMHMSAYDRMIRSLKRVLRASEI
jgi:hypothetical protein